MDGLILVEVIVWLVLVEGAKKVVMVSDVFDGLFWVFGVIVFY